MADAMASIPSTDPTAIPTFSAVRREDGAEPEVEESGVARPGGLFEDTVEFNLDCVPWDEVPNSVFVVGMFSSLDASIVLVMKTVWVIWFAEGDGEFGFQGSPINVERGVGVGSGLGLLVVVERSLLMKVPGTVKVFGGVSSVTVKHDV
jgi:hypothetical protein